MEMERLIIRFGLQKTASLKYEHHLLQEFVSGLKKREKEPEGLKMIKEAFKVFDCNGDGLITTEFMKLSILNAGNCTMKDVNQMMDILDSDKDGNIKLDDFQRIFIPPSSVSGSSSSSKAGRSSWCCIL